VTAAIEITARSIRLAVVEDRQLTHLRSWPIPTGADLGQVLGTVDLPARLGPVRVLIGNEEVLARLLIQPACPRERLDRVVGFELTGGGDADAPLADWTVVPGFGSGDNRVFGLAVKRGLVQRLRQALAVHGAKLSALTHPAVGMYHAWRSAGGAGSALLADVGGAATHIAVVRDDELALVRTLPLGMDTLVAQIADLRNLPPLEAAKLVTQLRSSSPDEVQHLVKRQAGQIAVALSGAVKFAKAQLQVDDWQPAAIALAGAGAQVHAFAEAIAERSGIPTRPFNPFAGLSSALPGEEMDRQSGLPSPWAAAIGGAVASRLVVDALADERRSAARFWSTDGALRAGVAVSAVAVIAALALNEVQVGRTAADVARLGPPDGLVARAELDLSAVSKLEAERKAAAGRMAWLDGEHRAGRVASELLAAVAAVQHPERCPVALAAYRVRRSGAGLTVELEGWAQSVGRMRTSDVLHAFEEGLRASYPPIAGIDERPQPIDRDRQRFHLVLSIPDRAVK
jgi:hypothetical protein